MLEAFGGFSLQLISIYQVVHALVSDMFAASKNYGPQMKAHSHSYHQSIINFFAWIEGHIEVGKLLSWVHKQFSEILSLEVGQTSQTQLYELSLGKSINPHTCHSFTEIYVEYAKGLALS